VIVAALATAAAIPAGAHGFVGESVVLNPAKTDLTGPAKTIITNPTFLPGTATEAATAGGAAEASTAMKVFQASKVLPALGAVTAFGVGLGVGSEICGLLGIEGCFFHGSEAADPAMPIGSWQYETALITEIPDFTWYYKQGASAYWLGFVQGQGGMKTECGIAPPSGVTHYKLRPPEPCSTVPAANPAIPLRHTMENRVLTHHASDDPGIPNYSYTAPADWSEKLAKELAGATGSEGKVGEKIASQITGSGVKNPYKEYVAVPDCDQLKWGACAAVLEGKGLEPIREDLDWSEVVTDVPDAVTQTLPASGNEVEVPSKVTVITNPDEAGMPIVIPTPNPGETYDDYVARLNPALQPSRVNVGEGFADPTVGPDAVLRTVPQPGTRFDPQTSPEVSIQTNPPTVPQPSTSTWTPPAIPSIDLTPLTEVSIGCNDFPFGVFCWLGAGITNWGSSGQCPNVDLPLGTSADVDSGLPFDFCKFEPAMEVVRPVLILLAAFTMAYMFAAAAMGFGGSTGSDD
jgi:hypothetical protein